MWVCTRRVNETLILGEEGLVEVIVLSTNNSRAKIGIRAPDAIKIYRNEIFPNQADLRLWQNQLRREKTMDRLHRVLESRLSKKQKVSKSKNPDKPSVTEH